MNARRFLPVVLMALSMPLGALAGGGGDKMVAFDYKVNATDVNLPSTFKFIIEASEMNNITGVQVRGGGLLTDYTIDRSSNTVTIVIDNSFVPVDNDKGEPGGGIIEIVGIDNISGVSVDENGSTSSPTLRIDNTKASVEGVDDDNTTVPNAMAAPPDDENTGEKTNDNSGNQLAGSNGGDQPATTRDDIEIYPNPVIDQTSIVTVGEILVRTGTVTDLSGRKQLDIVLNGDSQKVNLDMSALTSGIYIISIVTNKGTTIVKKVKKV